MNNIWSLTIEDYIAIVERAKAGGCQPGESMEKWFVEYMNEKNIKPIGKTELTKEELIKEQLSHGKSLLNIETNEGKTNFTVYKPEDK